MPTSLQTTPATPPHPREPGRRADFPGRRRAALEAARRALGPVDGLLVSDGHDIRYLTGVREGISWLAVSGAGTFAISRHMLIGEVQEQAPDCEILLPSHRSIDDVDLEGFLVGQLSARGLRRIVSDPARTTASAYLGITAHAASADIEILLREGLVATLRAVKDDWELDLTRRCVAIAELAFAGLVDGGAAALIGRTERDLANELNARMLALGADRQGFPGTGIIVASGPNSARAHHTPGRRRLAADDPLLIDWGAELSAYRCDSTRTLFIGGVPEFARRAYPVAERALHLAAGRLRDGAVMGEVDRAARQCIIDAGYPEFHYGVGHGVGLEIHEAPWIRASSAELLKTGMLTTIEPGIYLPGTGGIRIENVYHILAGSAEQIGELPTNLDSMILH